MTHEEAEKIFSPETMQLLKKVASEEHPDPAAIAHAAALAAEEAADVSLRSAASEAELEAAAEAAAAAAAAAVKATGIHDVSEAAAVAAAAAVDAFPDAPPLAAEAVAAAAKGVEAARIMTAEEPVEEHSRGRQLPVIEGKLRHILKMPQAVYKASGIVVMGRRIKSLMFSTDIAIIRNCDADAVFAVYPFTPQPAISGSLVKASWVPVFTGIGGGVTNGFRTVMLARQVEAQGAMGVVMNQPISNETLRTVSSEVDIPIVVTVASRKVDIGARLQAGVSILNVAAGAQTPELVRNIRKDFPDVPIIASGGPNEETIAETIEAGANAITITPPSTLVLFKSIMEGYRD